MQPTRRRSGGVEALLQSGSQSLDARDLGDQQSSRRGAGARGSIRKESYAPAKGAAGSGTSSSSKPTKSNGGTSSGVAAGPTAGGASSTSSTKSSYKTSTSGTSGTAAAVPSTGSHGGASTTASTSSQRNKQGSAMSASTQKILSNGRTKFTAEDFRVGADWWDPLADLHNKSMLNAMQTRHLEWERLRQMSKQEEQREAGGTATGASSRKPGGVRSKLQQAVDEASSYREDDVETGDVDVTTSTEIGGGASSSASSTVGAAEPQQKPDAATKTSQQKNLNHLRMGMDGPRLPPSQQHGSDVPTANFAATTSSTAFTQGANGGRAAPNLVSSTGSTAAPSSSLEVGRYTSNQSGGFGSLQPEGGHMIVERWRNRVAPDSATSSVAYFGRSGGGSMSAGGGGIGSSLPVGENTAALQRLKTVYGGGGASASSSSTAGAATTSNEEDQWHQLPREAVDAIARWKVGGLPGRVCLLQVLDSVFGQEADDAQMLSTDQENSRNQAQEDQQIDPEESEARARLFDEFFYKRNSHNAESASASNKDPSPLLRALSTSTGLGTNAVSAQKFVYDRVFAHPPMEALEFALSLVKKAALHADALCLAFRQLQLQLQARPFRERLLVQILAELVRLHLSSSGPPTMGSFTSGGATSSGAGPRSTEWTDHAVCDLLSAELGLSQYTVDPGARGALNNPGARTTTQNRFRFSSSGDMQHLGTTTGTTNGLGGTSTAANASSSMQRTVRGGTFNTPGVADNNPTTNRAARTLSNASDHLLDSAVSLEKLRVQNAHLESYVIKAARIRDDLKSTLETLENVDAYALLGLQKETATLEDAKKAFHKLARTAHPDKGGDPKAFQAIQHAYSTIQRSKAASGADHKIELSKEDGACLEPEELEHKLGQVRILEEQLKAARTYCTEASERADICADIAHRIRNISGSRSKNFRQLRAELVNELELCARLRTFFSQTARSAQFVARLASQAMTHLGKATAGEDTDGATGGPEKIDQDNAVLCEFVNAAALSDRIRICRDAASSCLVMSDSLEKIRSAVVATVDKVEKISDPSGSGKTQSDRMGKKLLVSSSERVEQTGRRAADEAISCAMKASDVVKGMSALLLEMRDRLKRANKPSEPTAPDEGSSAEDDPDRSKSKKSGDENNDSSSNEKKLEATTNRLRERHLVLRGKNLSFLSQINDEARDWQGTLFSLASGRMEILEKEELVCQLVEIFDVALFDLAHERGEITQAKLEKHLTFLLQLDSRLAVPTDVRSKICLMVAYADRALFVQLLEVLRRKLMQILVTKRKAAVTSASSQSNKTQIRDWLATAFQRVHANLRGFLTVAGCNLEEEEQVATFPTTSMAAGAATMDMTNHHSSGQEIYL
ncbi:unnamed protein product [Amoebophrya sp. A120]|nr:unnamed protein product [Amoebophrya sp. A120]|eukprot:GSA120T00003199001.1